VPVFLLFSLRYPRTSPLLFGSLGYAWSFVFSLYIIYPQLSSQLEGEDIQMKGVVSDVKSESHQYSKFIFNIDKASIQLLNAQVPNNIVLSWYQPKQKIQSHQQCNFVVRLKKIWGYSNPGGVDYEKNMFMAGMGARGYVRSGQCDELDSDILTKPSLRQQWIDGFQTIATNYRYANLMSALTFGEREDIEQHQW
tara:strand:- start:306 stop:890 length:585 start_codon:yes stop_codon:yes gene_type:complete